MRSLTSAGRRLMFTTFAIVLAARPPAAATCNAPPVRKHRVISRVNEASPGPVNRLVRHPHTWTIRKINRQTPTQLLRAALALDGELGVSEQTYHRWRNQFGWLKADAAKLLKDPRAR
jgi:hypothetical protein